MIDGMTKGVGASGGKASCMHGASISVGFIGRNPFQFMHVKGLMLNLPNSVYIAEVIDGNSSLNNLDEKALSEKRINFLPWDHDKLYELDGVFDVLVCQTPFEGIHKINKSKLAMIQYGYAKEPYNYGAWRSFADVNLVYGDYAASKIGNFSRTVVTGNPRYDVLYADNFKKVVLEKYGAIIDPQKKTLLYAPTWGQLSSIERFSNSILTLERQFNILVKSHHNTDLREKDRFKWPEGTGAHYFGAESDIIELIFISDIVVSDYSGAIFDAIYFEKPVVLLSENIENIIGEKMDRDSIEYARRDDLGLQVFEPSRVEAAVEFVLNNREQIIANAASLRRLLFSEKNSAIDLATSAIVGLCEEGPKDQIHGYIKSAMVSFYSSREKLVKKKQKAKMKNYRHRFCIVAERFVIIVVFFLLRAGIKKPLTFLKGIKVRDHYFFIYNNAWMVNKYAKECEKKPFVKDNCRLIDSIFNEKDFCRAKKIILQSEISIGTINKVKKISAYEGGRV